MSVTREFQPLTDYTLVTKSNKGGREIIHVDVMHKWFTNYYRKDLFFQSIGLDPLGLENFLESHGFAISTGKFDYPKDLLDMGLYFTSLKDSDEEFFGTGATPMESILSALTNMIARKGKYEVHKRFFADFWTAPGWRRTSNLFTWAARRQPLTKRAYYIWSNERPTKGVTG